MTTSAALVPVVLVVGEQRVDLAVTAGARLADVLHSRGIDPREASVTTSTGTLLDVDGSLTDQAGAGDVLWVVDQQIQTGGERAGDSHGGDDTRRRFPREGSGWLVCALTTALCLVVIASHSWALGGESEANPFLLRLGVAIALGAAAVVLAMRASGDHKGRFATGASLLDETVLAPVVGFTAAFLLATPGTHAAASLAVVMGSVAGACISTLRYSMSRRSGDPSEAVAAVLAVLWAVLALVFALAILFDLPSYVAPTLMLGTVPLIMRSMPSAALDISDEQLLDMPYLTLTAANVRGVQARSPSRVRWRMVNEHVRFAERRRGAGLLVASAITAVMSPVVLASYEPGGLRGWGTVALIALLVVFLALAPRTFRRTVEKAAPRLALLTVLIQLALFAYAQPELRVWALALIALAIGTAFLAVPLAQGYRSVRWSRLGDVVEGFAVVFIMPAALLAAGAVEGLQVLTAR